MIGDVLSVGLLLTILRSTFGQPGGPYDFSNVNDIAEETKRIEEQLKTKTKRIAPKDLMLLDTCVTSPFISQLPF